MHYFSYKLGTVAAIFFMIVACKKNIDSVRPEKSVISEAVYASGYLVPKEEYLVYSVIDGILVRAFVEENDSFSMGQPLFQIETNFKKVQERLLEDIYRTTLIKGSDHAPALKELDVRLLSLNEKIHTDSLQFSRINALLASGAVSKSDWDKSKLIFETGVQERRLIEEQRNALMLQSKMEIQNAANQFKSMQSQNADGLIKGRMNGILLETYKKVGERVSINEPIGLAGGGSEWIARLTIDERDFEKVSVGQTLFIQMDAFPDATYEGKIARILPKLNRAEQSFYAEAIFDTSPPKLMYGLNLEANILIRHNESALTIPRKALMKGDSVRINRDGKLMVVPIEVGIKNLDRIEVLNGLNENDDIILKQ